MSLRRGVTLTVAVVILSVAAGTWFTAFSQRNVDAFWAAGIFTVAGTVVGLMCVVMALIDRVETCHIDTRAVTQQVADGIRDDVSRQVNEAVNAAIERIDAAVDELTDRALEVSVQELPPANVRPPLRIAKF